MNMKRLGNLIVISGPSGVGKSTLIGELRAARPDLAFSISCTTRTPRPGERDGREYHFLTPEEFQRRLDRDEFLEHAAVFRHRYGTLKSEVLQHLRRGVSVLLDIDTQGASQIREAAKRDPELAAAAAFIMIVPPSLAELEKRLRGRSTESAEQLALRLAAAQRELDRFRLYDFLVVNGDLAVAAAQLINLVNALDLRTAALVGEKWE